MTIKTTQGIRNQHYRRISQWLGGQEVFTGPADATQGTPCRSDPLDGDQCVSVHAQGLSGRVPPSAVALASASATSDHHRRSPETFAPTRVKMHPAVEQLFSQYRPPPSSSHSTPSTATQMDPRYGYVAPQTAYDNLSVPPAVSPMVPPSVPAPPPHSSAPAHPSRYASHAETAVSVFRFYPRGLRVALGRTSRRPGDRGHSGTSSQSVRRPASPATGGEQGSGA